MTNYQVKASAVIDAPSELVYAIISDYHQGHPAILPFRYFTGITVKQGGRGAGTVVEVEMNVFGSRALYQMIVSEPEPGRVLQEEDAAAGVLTTFTVDSLNGGSQSRVTIATAAKTSPGFKGWLEKFITPAITRRIYREELSQLASIVQIDNRKEVPIFPTSVG